MKLKYNWKFNNLTGQRFLTSITYNDIKYINYDTPTNYKKDTFEKVYKEYKDQLNVYMGGATPKPITCNSIWPINFKIVFIGIPGGIYPKITKFTGKFITPSPPAKMVSQFIYGLQQSGCQTLIRPTVEYRSPYLKYKLQKVIIGSILHCIMRLLKRLKEVQQYNI